MVVTHAGGGGAPAVHKGAAPTRAALAAMAAVDAGINKALADHRSAVGAPGYALDAAATGVPGVGASAGGGVWSSCSESAREKDGVSPGMIQAKTPAGAPGNPSASATAQRTRAQNNAYVVRCRVLRSVFPLAGVAVGVYVMTTVSTKRGGRWGALSSTAPCTATFLFASCKMIATVLRDLFEAKNVVAEGIAATLLQRKMRDGEIKTGWHHVIRRRNRRTIPIKS